MPTARRVVESGRAERKLFFSLLPSRQTHFQQKIDSALTGTSDFGGKRNKIKEPPAVYRRQVTQQV